MRNFKVFFKDISFVNRAFAEIGLCKGVFLLKNASGGTQDDDVEDDVSRNIVLNLIDGSSIHIMSSDHFYYINQEGKLGFDWTEIYFFKDQLMSNIILNAQQETISQSDLYANFPQQCDFWAVSIDGSKLWMTTDSDTTILNTFLSYSDKFEEQNDLTFFNMVCNDLLFSI